MLNMTGKQRCEAAYNATVRMNAVVDLASLQGSDAFEVRLDRPAEDLIDDLLEDAYKVHPSLEPLRALARQADEEGGIDMLGEMLYHQNLLGLVVNFATPVMTKTGRSSHSYSWGFTQSTWIYADTYDAAWKLGIEWAEKCKGESEPAKKPAKRPRKAASAESAHG